MRLLHQIRRNLSDDLLLPKYRKQHRSVPTKGHCYVATEALYHLLGKRNKETFKPHYVKAYGVTHWYLMNEDRTEMLDPTYDQFPSLPNYDKGVRCGFLTKKPSKRAQILIDRIKK